MAAGKLQNRRAPGSHVHALSALSHHTGEMADEQLLYLMSEHRKLTAEQNDALRKELGNRIASGRCVSKKEKP